LEPDVKPHLCSLYGGLMTFTINIWKKPHNANLGWIYPICLVALFWGSIWFFHSSMFSGTALYDDAYITFRYAANIANGMGFTFNSYERVHSASSFGHTFLLAGLHAIGFSDLPSVSILLGMVFGAGLIVFCYKTIRFILDSDVAAALLTLPICLSGSISFWSVSGMETIPFAAIVSIFFYFRICNSDVRYAALAAGIAFLYRYEGLILIVCLIGAEIIHDYSEGFDSTKWKSIGALCVLPIVAVTVFSYQYFGSILPHPVEFKKLTVYYSNGPFQQIWDTLVFYIKRYGIYMIGAILSAVFWISGSIDPKLRSCVGFISAYVLLSFISFSAGPISEYHRYTIHLIPVLAIGTAMALTFIRKNATRMLILCILISFTASLGALLDQRRITSWYSNSIEIQTNRKSLGQWINENIPPTERIVSSDLGALSYFASRHDFIDALGLTDKKALEAIRKGDWAEFLLWFKEMRPKYVADTVHSRDIPEAVRILSKPSLFFKNIRADFSIDEWFTLVPLKIIFHEPECGVGVYRIIWLQSGARRE
jgi:arabinofuranosyltransferase